MSNRLQRSSINLISSGLGYIIPMLVSLISTPLLLNGLGETAFGLQSLVAVVIGYLMVMEMGLGLPIVKLLAEDRAKNDIESENKMLSTTLQLYFLFGLIGMIVIILCAGWFARSVFKVPSEMISQSTIVFQLAGLGFLGNIGMSWGRSLTSGLQRYEITHGVSTISSIVGTAFGLLLVYTGYGVIGYVSVRVFASLIIGPTYWLIARRMMPSFKIKWGIDRASLRRIKWWAGYGLFNQVVSSFASRLDQTLIGIWIGVAAAGVYSVPFMILSQLGNLIANTLGFIFSMVSELLGLGELN